MSTNSFRIPKFVDHVIEGQNARIVGTVRIKPSGVAWAPVDAKKWRTVSLAKFMQFMNNEGRLTAK